MTNELLKRLISSIFLLPIVFIVILEGDFFFNCFILICLFISIYEWFMISKNKKLNFLGIIFLILSFFSAFLLRTDMYGDFTYFSMILIICIFTDIGGYVFGKILKGPKLTKISPKKTYAGSLGGVFCSIFIITLLFNNSNYISELINVEIKDKEFSFNFFIFVIFISMISQIGDIIMSYFKRQSNLKNTGNIIPGHGGLLDRIDGMIFAFPISFLIFKFFY